MTGSIVEGSFSLIPFFLFHYQKERSKEKARLWIHLSSGRKFSDQVKFWPSSFLHLQRCYFVSDPYGLLPKWRNPVRLENRWIQCRKILWRFFEVGSSENIIQRPWIIRSSSRTEHRDSYRSRRITAGIGGSGDAEDHPASMRIWKEVRTRIKQNSAPWFCATAKALAHAVGSFHQGKERAKTKVAFG